MKMQSTSLYPVMLYTLVLAIAGLAACSSTSTDSPPSADASNVIVSGRITGFGSVFVDGVEYETGQAVMTLDGQPVVNGERDLDTGMIVTIEGSANGASGIARSIIFNDELEGLVQANDLAGGGVLQVMGQHVRVDASTNFESRDASITTPETIPLNAIVEISGYPDGNGNILATYIHLKAVSLAGYSGEMEVKGVIKNLVQNTGVTTFTLGKATVDASSIASSLTISLANDLYVEVKSKTGFDAVTGYLLASKIELEDDGRYGISGEVGDDIDVEGVISAIDITAGTIQLNGQVFTLPVGMDVSNYSPGELVKVELNVGGNGNPVVRKIETEEAHDRDNMEMKVQVEAIDPANSTITAGGSLIVIDKFKTLFVDHGAAPDKYFNFDSIAIGDRLELAIYIDSDGSKVAVKVERTGPESADDG